MRASKTVNGVTTNYQYVSGKLMYEDRNGTDIYYYYDSNGTPTAIRYYEADGTSHRFFLATNQQGDVIGLYNASGNLVVKYEYDAWGKIISETNATGGTPTSLAQKWSDINPFRYRGYYYDSETGLYYLQSRYYDAEVGRFLNADSQLNADDLLGYNTYAYSENNPINKTDPTGHMAITGTIAATNCWNPVGWIAAAALIVEAIAVVIAACFVIEQVATVVKDTVEAVDNIVNTKDQSVYVLTDSNDKVRYVGRTNDPKRREYEHKHDAKHKERQNYKMKVVATDLNIPSAKIAEQTLISAYSLSYLDNARREIAVGNLSGYQDNIGAVIEIFGSITDDELMNLMGR